MSLAVRTSSSLFVIWIPWLIFKSSCTPDSTSTTSPRRSSVKSKKPLRCRWSSYRSLTTILMHLADLWLTRLSMKQSVSFIEFWTSNRCTTFVKDHLVRTLLPSKLLRSLSRWEAYSKVSSKSATFNWTLHWSIKMFLRQSDAVIFSSDRLSWTWCWLQWQVQFAPMLRLRLLHSQLDKDIIFLLKSLTREMN